MQRTPLKNLMTQQGTWEHNVCDSGWGQKEWDKQESNIMNK